MGTSQRILIPMEKFFPLVFKKCCVHWEKVWKKCILTRIHDNDGKGCSKHSRPVVGDVQWNVSNWLKPLQISQMRFCRLECWRGKSIFCWKIDKKTNTVSCTLGTRCSVVGHSCFCCFLGVCSNVYHWKRSYLHGEKNDTIFSHFSLEPNLKICGFRHSMHGSNVKERQKYNETSLYLAVFVVM